LQLKAAGAGFVTTAHRSVAAETRNESNKRRADVSEWSAGVRTTDLSSDT